MFAVNGRIQGKWNRSAARREVPRFVFYVDTVASDGDHDFGLGFVSKGMDRVVEVRMMRNHFVRVGWWLTLAVASALTVGATADPRPPTTVVIVRHAEKANTPKANPPLTDAGRARAELLAKMLRTAGVSAVYTSGFARTDQTAKPIADAVGVALTRYDARHSRALAELLKRASAGSVGLVVGHSNTIPDLLAALGVDRRRLPTIADDEYDNLFVVTLFQGKASLVCLRYGASTGGSG